MRQAITIACLVACTSCTSHARAPRAGLPEDTDREYACVLRNLADEKKFGDIETACMPGDGKRLVYELSVLEDSKDLYARRADVSVQASIVLHEAGRKGYHIVVLAPGERVR